MTTQAAMYESVNADKVNGAEEWIAIGKLAPAIAEFRQEDSNWHRDFNFDCFIILDDLDWKMFETFNNHARRDRQ